MYGIREYGNTGIREYEDDKNYSKFRHDFMKTSDHGRSSWRIADALGLKIITSNIEIEYTRYKHYKEDHIRLHLKQQKTLRDSENPLVLPFRINYVAIGIKVRGTLFGFSTTIVIWMDSKGLLPCAAIGLV
jgi:hypothetical protein